MSLITALLAGPSSQKALDSAQLADMLWGKEVKSGVVVSAATAMRVATVFGCIRVIAEDVSKVPLGLYQDKPDGSKEKALDHALHRVLARRPNQWMTSQEFRETMTIHALLCGGGFAYINRVRGEVRELLPFMPGTVVVRVQPNWDRVYEVTDLAGKVATLTSKDVLHLRGPSWNGVQGMEMINQAREAVGLSIATEESQARLHANGARPSGLLSTDAKLTKEQIDRIRGQWQDAYGGVANAMKTLVMDAGMKFTQMSMTGVDAQHLETRKHQIEEVCRFFRVHPTKVFADVKSASYASMEQNAISHVQDTLLPWFTRWEQVIDRDLLTEAEIAGGYYAHHVVQGMLRGDSAARAAYYKAGVNDGWMTRNEVRQLEELNPLPQLDKPLRPLNMVTVEDQVEPTPGTEVVDAGGAAAVQDTALNGAQVASLLAIVQAVADGTLPAATARAMILASFPGVSPETIDAMLSGLEGWEAPEPEDATEPADPADDPEEDATEGEGMKAMGESLRAGLVALAGGLAAKSGRAPELVFTRDATGAVIGAKIKE